MTEKYSNLKGCYQIVNTDGEIIAELLATTVETFNDTSFLKRVIDVLETRYFKLRDMRSGHNIQITLEDGGHIKMGE